MSFVSRLRARAPLGSLLGLAIAIALAACGTTAASPTTTGATSTTAHPASTEASTSTSTSSSTVPRKHHHVTTTTAPHPTTTTKAPTTTLPALGSPGPGLVAGRVTILGDSVTVDAQPDLQLDIKGAQVLAGVSEQWYQGVEEAQSLRAQGALGVVVVVALGTNGPITSGEIADMVHAVAGASRIVFVTNHVPTRYWQNPNNQVIEQSASVYKNVVVADWASLAAQHPGWFASDQVHMAIGGPGAQAMAALIASKV